MGDFEREIRHVLAYGNSLGAHGGLTDKGFHMYEETVHTPLIVEPPKGTAYKERVAEFVNTTDLYSTILDIAGVSKEEHERDGRSVLPPVSGSGVPDWPNYVVTEFTGLGYTACSQRIIRQGDYKYVFTAGDKGELYNLSKDPDEMENLHEKPEHQERLEELQILLYNWLSERGDRFAADFKRYLAALSHQGSGGEEMV